MSNPKPQAGPSPVPAKPSGTIVCVSDQVDAEGQPRLHVLLLRRNPVLKFHGGEWAFPGGRVDPEDFAAAAPGDDTAAAGVAAVREAHEEAGLELAVSDLAYYSHWTTPEGLPKRFATWFFLCRVAAQTPIEVDGEEMVDWRWVLPAEAIVDQTRGDIPLPPPTYVTLLELNKFRTTDALWASLAQHVPPVFVPRLRTGAKEGDSLQAAVSLEPRDPAAGEPLVAGPSHRLVMTSAGWSYREQT